MTYCAKCGTPLPPGAQFCPRCGTALAAPPSAPVPAAPPPAPPVSSAPSARAAWWIVPIVLLLLGGLAWLILAGLPFGRTDRDRPRDTPRVETIAEGTVAPPAPPAESATIIDVPGEAPSQQPPPRVEPDPQPELLNDEQASATLRDYVTSRDYYRVGSECIRVESRGFRNRGFDYEIWHSCESSGASRLLGRWRVDAKTREVFRRYEDGRYLRP